MARLRQKVAVENDLNTLKESINADASRCLESLANMPAAGV